MQPLGAGLRQPVGERLDHDRSVVVVLGLVPLHELVGAEPRGDRERADVVGEPGLGGRDEVRERSVRLLAPGRSAGGASAA